jgi:anti-sigma factor RsiW
MKLQRELACQEVVELVTAYLDDALGAGDRERFEEHLAFCDGCANYLEQIRMTVRLTADAEVGLPPALEERFLEAFRGWHES